MWTMASLAHGNHQESSTYPSLFGEAGGTLFLFDVQAHGIEDQENFNADSRINDGDLVEGGQLLFLERVCFGDVNADGSVDYLDVIETILNFGYCPSCSTDVNGDGWTNWADVLIVLTNVGNCD